MINRFERPEPQEVSLDLTDYLQGVALRGWSSSLPDRSMEELGAQFRQRTRSNPNTEHLESVRGIYQDYASHGGLLLAYTDERADPIGFSLAGTDVSGNSLARSLKLHLFRSKAYAHLRHICIDRPYQGEGNFYPMVAESFAAGFFRPRQVPTAYIFKENKVAWNAFTKLGFRVDPADQRPQILESYFGLGRPVEQLRFAAESVRAVVQNARSHMPPQTS